MSDASGLHALADDAMRAFKALSPVDQALHIEDQRRSFIRGQTGRDPGPSPLAEEVRRLREENAALRAGRDDGGAVVNKVWIVFGGSADQFFLRFLKPGFCHCFALFQDERGWVVLEPLPRRLFVHRLPVTEDFDVPSFYAKAGLSVKGPFKCGETKASWFPTLSPMTCVNVCRAAIGGSVPFAVTPYGLWKKLNNWTRILPHE